MSCHYHKLRTTPRATSVKMIQLQGRPEWRQRWHPHCQFRSRCPSVTNTACPEVSGLHGDSSRPAEDHNPMLAQCRTDVARRLHDIKPTLLGLFGLMVNMQRAAQGCEKHHVTHYRPAGQKLLIRFYGSVFSICLFDFDLYHFESVVTGKGQIRFLQVR